MQKTITLKTRLNFADIYLLCLGAWSFMYSIFRESTFTRVAFLDQKIYTAVWLGIQVVLVLKILLADAKELSALLKILLVGILGYISYSNSKSGFLTPFFWFLAASRGTNSEDNIRTLYLGQLTAMVVIVSCAALGIIENITFVRNLLSLKRFSMGYGHPNSFAQKVFQLEMMWVYLNRRRFNILHLAVILSLGFVTLLITDSRSAWYLTIAATALLMLCFMIQQREGFFARFSKMMIRFLRYTVLAISGVSVMIAMGVTELFANTSLAEESTMVSRFEQAERYFVYYSIMPFGQPLYYHGAGAEGSAIQGLYTLDNGYLYLLLGFGWVIFALFLLAYGLRMRKAIREKDYITLILISAYAIYGFTETGMIRFSLNFTLVLLFDILWNKKQRRNRQQKNPYASLRRLRWK